MSYAYFAGSGKRGRDLGRKQVRKLVAEKTKQNEPSKTEIVVDTAPKKRIEGQTELNLRT